MSEKRILLASLLKPVNDTRMFEKLGLSICKLNQLQVHIAGFNSLVPAHSPTNISFYPVFNFKRLSTGRLKAQHTYWKLLLAVKPHLIIVCTHELLPVTVLYKKRYKCKIIYDIQENYTLNLLSQGHYANGIRQLLATGISVVEKLSSKTIDHFLLAERSYAQELPFTRGKATIIENKFKPAVNYTYPYTPVKVSPSNLKLLYTGTIAKLFGIFEAIALADKLFLQSQRISLTIIGYCASSETLSDLYAAIKGKPYITLIGGDKLVPHQQILEAMKTHDIGLMPYRYNKSTHNCIPTKLYEYIALGVPVIIQKNPLWHDLIRKYNTGISTDYNKINISELIPILLKSSFYQNGIPNEVFWNTEEQKLLTVIGDFLPITDLKI